MDSSSLDIGELISDGIDDSLDLFKGEDAINFINEIIPPDIFDDMDNKELRDNMLLMQSSPLPTTEQQIHMTAELSPVPIKQESPRASDPMPMPSNLMQSVNSVDVLTSINPYTTIRAPSRSPQCVKQQVIQPQPSVNITKPHGVSRQQTVHQYPHTLSQPQQLLYTTNLIPVTTPTQTLVFQTAPPQTQQLLHSQSPIHQQIILQANPAVLYTTTAGGPVTASQNMPALVNGTILTTNHIPLVLENTSNKVPVSRATKVKNAKQVAHLKAELLYRATINDKITELKNLLVGKSVTLKKSAVLQITVDKVRDLQKENNELKAEILSLQRKLLSRDGTNVEESDRSLSRSHSNITLAPVTIRRIDSKQQQQ